MTAEISPNAVMTSRILNACLTVKDTFFVEGSSFSGASDFFLELVNFLIDVFSILLSESAVRGLYAKFAHTLKHGSSLL